MSRTELILVIETFPEHAQAARQLFLSDHRFRDLCADFTLARTTLDSFESLSDASLRPEVAEYRQLVQELIQDIAAFLGRTEH